MEYLPISLLAGILTILAPCVLPLLPVIVGGSIGDTSQSKGLRKPLLIVLGLSITIVGITLTLRLLAELFPISTDSLRIFSAIVIIIYGLFELFPQIWESSKLKLLLSSRAQQGLQSAAQKQGNWWSPVLLGIALGPVFSSCSPTFLLLISTVLPQSIGIGIFNILIYVLGLAVTLLLVAGAGSTFFNNYKWAVDPNSWFRKILAGLLILVGLMILLNIDRRLEALLLDLGLPNFTSFESSLLRSIE